MHNRTERMLNKLTYANAKRWFLGQYMQKPLISLPQLNVARAPQLDRSPFEGYQRGWGLEFGDLTQEIWRDPLYQRARKFAKGRSIMTIERQMNLFLLIRFFLKDLASKNIIEFGTYNGGNAFFMAALLRELYPEAKVFALDTFEGMPDVDQSLDNHRRGDFGDANLQRIQRQAEAYGLTNLTLVKGLIQDTADTVYEVGAPFGLAHIDVDIYSAVKYSQDSVWAHMTPGGYVVYDDATVSSCIGATQAVEELVIDRHVHSEQIFPHFVFRVPPVNNRVNHAAEEKSECRA